MDLVTLTVDATNIAVLYLVCQGSIDDANFVDVSYEADFDQYIIPSEFSH